MKTIKLSKGYEAIVDDEDYTFLNQFSWCISSNGYAVHTQPVSKRRVTVLMHRMIMNTPDGLLTDHIDHDKLNNQKENLRICTVEQNQHNQAIRRDNWCGYKGITYSARDKKWIAQIVWQQKHNYIGLYDNPIDAAKAYDNKARELFGAFAYLNFQEEK